MVNGRRRSATCVRHTLGAYRMHWEPRDGENAVTYDPLERRRYEGREPSTYELWAWPSDLLRGRDRRASRCFPEVAVRAHYERLGYQVLLSVPKYPGDLGYLLFHFRGLRRQRPPHPAFARIQAHFPNIDLHALAEAARLEKIAKCGNTGGGGDPDLFVFRWSGERFFVEVKDRDQLKCNQRVCFRLIEERLACPVKVVRVVPGTGAA
jgi:hypothetical protein